MISKATTVEAYLQELEPDRRKTIAKIRAEILKNLPAGFEETMTYGMIGYVVPKSIYPEGYHCDPKTPLPFLSLASQKNYISFYHMALQLLPDLESWFRAELLKIGQKVEIGKACIRFKKTEQIPSFLIGEMVSKVTLDEWIRLYEINLRK
jgi:uncharacterized protein YdhG (YjbR/CyaY superfamily)